MPDPAGERATAGSPANGSGSEELAQLRQLLIGQDLAQLAEIQKRLDDPVRRSSDVAQILADAIRAARARALRDALEPILEKAFQSSVRKHPRLLADAIYPVIGPALRNSIAAAIREFAESLNQVVEKSASFRALRWRIEARLTGKPFTEILLARSLLYRVEQVFLIHRKSGILLLHVAAQGSVVKDADMIGGMLTAVQDFVSDSFTEGGQDVETVDVGRFKLWIQYGSKALLVAAVSGSAPVALKDVFLNALDQVQERLYAELDTFKQEDVSVFEPARPFLEACLLGQSKQKRRFVPWLILMVVVLLAAALVIWRMRSEARWDQAMEALKQQPGIVVTHIENRRGTYLVEGLKDPNAPDPARLIEDLGLDPAKVHYDWKPYHSLNTTFAADRELEAATRQVEKQIVRFEVGSPKLQLGETDHVENTAAAIQRLLRARPGIRVLVIGHTDEVGGPETNSQLSEQRANEVIAALVALGVPRDRLEARGVASTQPLRKGGGSWDRASNRRVSFALVGQ